MVARRSAISLVGRSSSSTTSGSVGSASARASSTRSASRRPASSSGSSRRSSAPAQTASSRPSRLSQPPRGVIGFSVIAAAGPQPDRLDAERARERPVLALGVDDPRDPAEDGLAEEVGLDQRRLRRADGADDEHVRVREHALRVELEGVEAERPAVEVAADVHAATAEPALGDERVDRLGAGGRRAMAVALGEPLAPRPAITATRARAARPRPCRARSAGRHG